MDHRSTAAAVQPGLPAQAHPEPGARGLRSEIGAASCGSLRRSDADIARSARRLLRSITLLPTGCIQVAVDGGWITLSGRAQWNYQRQAATAAARHVIGATGATICVTVDDDGSPAATRRHFDLL